MKRVFLFGLAVLLFAGNAAPASDPVGIYAVVDKIVTEPSEGPADRIMIWGTFRLAGQGRGGTYEPAQRGFMYFALVKDKENQCRNEWNDFKKVAGTNECVAFASRYEKKGTVRKAGSDPKPADPYPLGFGVEKVGKDHPIAQELCALPSPVSPAEGDLVPTGSITLQIRNSAGSGSSKVKYLFVIEDEAGKQEASDPVAAGEKETTWTPKMQLKAGGKYTWRVWTRDDTKEDKSQAVTTHFTVKGK